MTRDSSSGPGRWRAGRSSRHSRSSRGGRRQKWAEAAAISALLLGAAVVLGWIAYQFLFRSGPNPLFVPFWIATYQRPEIPPVPWMPADREALAKSRVFANVDPSENIDASPTLEMIRTRLTTLAGRQGDQSVVVYLGGRANVDQSGKIEILANDSDPYEVSTQLPLKTLLDELRRCRIKNKLLVLDIMSGVADPRDLGGTTDGVGDLLREELESQSGTSAETDGGVLVIAACSPGETAQSSYALRRSVFGYFFQKGLTGKEADKNGDDVVTVAELARYLQSEVDRWARHYRGVHQQPFLAGPKGGDFELAMIKPQGSWGGWARLWPFGRVKPEPATEDSSAEEAPARIQEDAKTSAKGKESESQRQKEGPAKGATGKTDGANKGQKEAGEANGRKGESSTHGADVYPDWLSAAWTLLQNSWTSGDFRASPRVFRRLVAALLGAEERWKGGEVPDSGERELAPVVSKLSTAMDEARKVTSPPHRSVGQALAFGWHPDASLCEAMAGLLKQRRSAGEAAPDLAASVKAFLARLAGKTRLDLAGAIVEATSDETFDVATLAFLSSTIEQSNSLFEPSAGPNEVVELRFLRLLAGRAKAGAAAGAGDWSAEVARKAWDTVMLAERVNFQMGTFAWVKTQLDQADSRLHVAQVLTLPQATGAVPINQILRAWEEAGAAYQLVASRQKTIGEAQKALDRSLAVLPCLVPYLEAAPDAALQSAWLESAEIDVRLAKLLQPPAHAGQAGTLMNDLTEATRRLDALTVILLRPFAQNEVGALVQQSTVASAAPDAGLIVRIEALLRTPFPAASDRKVLWKAERALERRLSKRPASGNDGSAAAPHDSPAQRAGPRCQRLGALLTLAQDAASALQLEKYRQGMSQLAGPGRPNDATGASDLSDAARVWSAAARCFATDHAAFLKLAGQIDREDAVDCAGWLAPACVANWKSNPMSLSRERDAALVWSWIAGHYWHQSRDLHELVDPDGFYEKAARECPGGADQAADSYPEFAGPGSSLSISAGQPIAETALSLRLGGAVSRNAEKVTLALFSSHDPRLRAKVQPAVLELTPDPPSTASVRVEWYDDASRTSPPPTALIVQATQGNTGIYHTLLPMSITSAETIPKLLFSSDAARPDEVSVDPLRLRPLAGVRQRFYVFVRNPAPTAASVLVEVVEGDAVIARSGEKPLAIPPGVPLLVPSFGGPAPKEGERLRELTGSLRLRLGDAASSKVFDEQPLRVEIASPRDYLRITGAQFVPATPERPNRLTVAVRALPEMNGPDARVDLILPNDKRLFPTLRAQPKGRLSGAAGPGKPLTLFADNLALDANDSAECSFYLNVDGVKRALWLRARFPQFGGPQRVTEPDQPDVRFRAIPVVESGKSALLRVAFEVDNAPPGARLVFHVKDADDGTLEGDITSWRGPARKQRIGFDTRGEGGALLFEASLEDQTVELPVAGIRGMSALRADLMDATGKNPLAHYEMELMLDDLPPRDLDILLKDHIDKTKGSLPVRLNLTPPPSGIKEVTFLVGSKADFDKAEAAPRLVKAQSVDPSGRTWEATLQVPKEASGKLKVSARATSVVGLVEFKEADVEVVEAPTAEANAKPAAPKPGAIEGTVIEGNLPQKEVEVLLYDPATPANQNALKQQTKTDAKGTYSFTGLEPKRYRLYCKGASLRTAVKDVDVEGGKTIRADLELLYK
jgi:hypothetical protein